MHDSVNDGIRITGNIFLILIIAEIGFCIGYLSVILWPGLILIPISVWVERIGISFQLLAGIPAVTEWIGESRIKQVEENLINLHLRLTRARPFSSFVLFNTTSRQIKFDILIVWIMVFLWWLMIVLIWLVTLHDTSPKAPIRDKWWLVLVFGFAGAPYSAAAANSLTLLLARIFSFLTKFDFRRMLIIVSFPLFMIGTILQLLSTFLR